jgi:membrane associated rhomboid family serine protease
MIPIKDDNPTQSTPFVTVTLIALNVVIFIYQLTLSPQQMVEFTRHYAAIPEQISQGKQLYAIFTSMFLHGGVLHLLGNMLYLWIFGDNIEHICGHGRFLAFYLLCGLFAFFSHYITMPGSDVPMVGASGAISGVLGAYAIRFPRARVHVFIWFFFFLYTVVKIPALYVLGIWFVMQIFSGLAAAGGQSGVAFFAHIGGFIAGLIFIRYFERRSYRARMNSD